MVSANPQFCVSTESHYTSQPSSEHRADSHRAKLPWVLKLQGCPPKAMPSIARRRVMASSSGSYWNSESTSRVSEEATEVNGPAYDTN